MGQRTELHTILEAIVPKVYFQPPENITMEYPCIVFQRDDGDTLFAGNKPYRYTQRYVVTHISREPDTEAIVQKIAALPQCSYNRFFTADNLNHDVFTIFF